MNTDKWINKIDGITNEFKKTFGTLSAEQLNWKPNEQTWSIGQNIDHLIVINGTYDPVIKAVRDGNYKLPVTAKMDFMVNFLGKTVLKAVKPDRKKKMKTFPIWEPAKSKIADDILHRFEKHQADLKQMIAGCSDLLDKDTVISSPANKNIVYRLEKAFDIITTHEQRHFEQAKELLPLLPK
ncbi:MAG: DinB family protein [Bacteroidia bacterium]